MVGPLVAGGGDEDEGLRLKIVVKGVPNVVAEVPPAANKRPSGKWEWPLQNNSTGL
jgi:hypothetical protein